ncbi:amidohydrolase [Consotaella salsifontis]|uniref:Amidohydrolase n=1 Tax=Consotaella salsifontis TaxID=1365950 RepID=A0A1T4PUU4_9HYPH|nr:amidohydrolase [Consotaella salsifontis]SJZ95322.1 amidohydrolase [Consotaella salsifontis]
MHLTHEDVAELTAWRRSRHQHPELSGEEIETAHAVAERMRQAGADRLFTGLGGHGLAAVFEGGEDGPTVMLRAELDALPIEEDSSSPHRSTVPGKGHLCGHDGHMAILAGVALLLGRQRPERGRVVLLFQPAEETGAGAEAVISDPRFAEIKPDLAFAFHNLPGLALGEVRIKDGPANCASRGMVIRLEGRTAHASTPQSGVSPMRAVAQLMPALTALGSPDILNEDFAMVTVTHAEMGERCFGVAPGAAEIWATLRTLVDGRMDALVQAAESLVRITAGGAELSVEMDYREVFAHCENDTEATRLLRRALDGENVPHRPGEPMRASEDFGRFRAVSKTAMAFLGAGEEHADLHNPDYDFPDELIAIGARIFSRLVRDILG